MGKPKTAECNDEPGYLCPNCGEFQAAYEYTLRECQERVCWPEHELVPHGIRVCTNQDCGHNWTPEGEAKVKP